MVQLRDAEDLQPRAECDDPGCEGTLCCIPPCAKLVLTHRKCLLCTAGMLVQAMRD